VVTNSMLLVTFSLALLTLNFVVCVFSEKMSSELPDTQAANNVKISSGDVPHSPLHNKFLVPSPVPTRRNRTYSA